MRCLLAPTGTIGDVYPSIGLAAALVARGHDVFLLANPYYEQAARDSGAEFVAVGSLQEQKDMLADPDCWHPTRGWKPWFDLTALRWMRPLYHEISRLYSAGRTVLAAPALSFGARIAQEKLGIPMASLHLEPDKLRSLHRTSINPPPLMMFDWVPRFLKKAQFRLADQVVGGYVLPRLETFRSELGLPQISQVLVEWWNSPDCVIGLFPEWWGPRQPDWPSQVELTDFPLWDSGDSCGNLDEADRFFGEGNSPPIIFSPGAVNEHARQFFEAAVQSCQQLNRRGVLLTKHDRQLSGELPAGVKHFSYLPFSRFLKRAALLVHHAGIGTSAQCLAAGIPHLVTPLAHPHFDTADRLRRLGVAAVVKQKSFQPKVVTRAIKKLVNSVKIKNRCAEIAERFKRVQPFETACDVLEAIAGTEANVRSYTLQNVD